MPKGLENMKEYIWTIVGQMNFTKHQKFNISFRLTLAPFLMSIIKWLMSSDETLTSLLLPQCGALS